MLGKSRFWSFVLCCEVCFLCSFEQCCWHAVVMAFELKVRFIKNLHLVAAYNQDPNKLLHSMFGITSSAIQMMVVLQKSLVGLALNLVWHYTNSMRAALSLANITTLNCCIEVLLLPIPSSGRFTFCYKGAFKIFGITSLWIRTFSLCFQQLFLKFGIRVLS